MSRAQVGFITAGQFRQLLRGRYPREDGWTHKRLGEHLGLSAGFVGMLLKGTREPSRAALEALKMEAVTFYRLKVDPFTGCPWGEDELVPRSFPDTSNMTNEEVLEAIDKMP